MVKVYEIDGITPVVHPTAFVHPSAVLIGDVIVGPHCYVGPAACLRGDFGRIELEEGANVQDACVMHSYADSDAVIERYGHIGHGAILHGCRIGRNALVGMNAVVMDGALIGAESLVAAMSFVRSGMQVPPRSMVVGMPARVLRELTDEEVAQKTRETEEYIALAQRSRDTMREVDALDAPEAGRRRIGAGRISPA
ncbi:transferase hexapeptide repeat family protein [Noviherbaspirillum suwonense]|jgi:phenylacetic acid degradation protein|uniref:Phenylacetic acid degradation protein n=1 Tax=Noviherbaspirillum suwonense TaxID=1224511 RepID=A0ABY1PW17_9BURK|nr:transferase hexapeptide repeat family protein [Noviherbaspirillum suwonense]SMP49013.1 phenylacetic acid degradation protein [Noviherbaspirillum suwonense]